MTPTSRESLLGSTFDCECGRRHVVTTRRLVTAPGALDQLVEVATAELPAGEWAMAWDRHTYEAAGRAAEERLKAAGKRLRPLLIDEDEPSATVQNVAALAERAEGVAAVISVGSGTVNDLGKGAATRLSVPFLTVGTAASMNGYTSSITALLDDGLKTTVPATPAVAVVCDLDVMAAAPVRLTRAGLGDVVSKPACNADWRLSHILLGAHFCPRPVALIKELEDVYLPRAEGLLRGDRETLGALTEALLYSGVSMCIAGSSAPASGAEHLISHTIDMMALLADEAHDLHGTQVGVGTSFMLRLYDWAMARSAADFATPITIDIEAMKTRLEREWGPTARAVVPQALAQFDANGRPQIGGAAVVEAWPRIVDELAPILAGSDRIERALRAAGAAAHYEQLGLDRSGFEDVVRRASFIRNRYTLLHLLRDHGLLEDGLSAVLADWRA